MFFKTDVLENFAIIMGKHLCWSLLLIELEVATPLVAASCRLCFCTLPNTPKFFINIRCFRVAAEISELS